MSNNASPRNRFDPRTPAGKVFWTLYLTLLVSSGIAALLLGLPGLSKPLYTFIAAAIILGNAFSLNIFVLNPDPAERLKVTVMLVIFAIVGILISMAMWLFSIPEQSAFWLSLSVGLMASQVTAVEILRYQQQRKLTQR